MSFTGDAVSAFKNTFLPAVQKNEAKGAVAAEAVAKTSSIAPVVQDQSLLAVARDSADIRRNHDAILTRVASLDTLQDDLLAAFDRAHQALEQLAEARSQLAKAETVAKFEHEAREVATQRLGSMTASYHQTVAELEKLRPEAKRLEVSLRQASEKVGQFEIDNTAIAEQLGEARAEIDRKTVEETAARREREAAKAELAMANAYVSQKLSEISQLHERCEIAEQSANASTKSLEESRVEGASALLRLDEERVNFASAQSRIAALETQLRDLAEKFSSSRIVWSQEAERFNEQVGHLKSDLAQAIGRDEAHQRLLTSAQSDLSATRLRGGELETQLAEAQANAAQAIARAEAAEAARDQNLRDVASSKGLHQSMLRRVKPMISALREKNAESVKLAATLGDFEQRFQTYQAEAAETIANLQDKETQLVADLETERARRVVAEGSLAIDRSFRPIETHRKRTVVEPEASPQLLGNRRQT